MTEYLHLGSFAPIEDVEEKLSELLIKGEGTRWFGDDFCSIQVDTNSLVLVKTVDSPWHEFLESYIQVEYSRIDIKEKVHEMLKQLPYVCWEYDENDDEVYFTPPNPLPPILATSEE